MKPDLCPHWSQYVCRTSAMVHSSLTVKIGTRGPRLAIIAPYPAGFTAVHRSAVSDLKCGDALGRTTEVVSPALAGYVTA